MADAAEMLPEPSTLAAFAKRVQVDEKAIRKGIRNGRLQQSLGTDANGRVVIVDAALAEQEWERNRDVSKIRSRDKFATIAEEKRRLIRAQSRKIELANKERTHQLVPIRAVEIRYATRVVTARSKLLGITSRAKQRLPHLTATDLEVMADLIREALTELGTEPAMDSE